MCADIFRIFPKIEQTIDAPPTWELYPELVDDVWDAFTQYYTLSMSHGFKALGHWVFQKV